MSYIHDTWNMIQDQEYLHVDGIVFFLFFFLFGSKNKANKKIKIFTRPVGLEPTIAWLEVRRLIH